MVAQFNIFKPPDLIQFQVAADIKGYSRQNTGRTQGENPSGHKGNELRSCSLPLEKI